MSIPDWTEAPDDATHWDTWCDIFCKDRGYWFSDGSFMIDGDQTDWGTDRYIGRPTGLDGEGYPPIGWHGQVTWGCKVRWIECVMLSGDAVAVGGEGDWSIELFCKQMAPRFKPLPTKEEWARDEIIDCASKAIEMGHGLAGSAYKKYCRALHAAGMLRKADDA